jgi:hypothetical protein
MRADVLRGTPRIAPYVGSDRNLLAEIGLHGRILELPAVLCERRSHGDTMLSRYPDELERLAWFDPERAGRRSFPTWRRLGGYLAAVWRAPLGAGEALRCHGAVSSWLVDEHHRGGTVARALAEDLWRGARG